MSKCPLVGSDAVALFPSITAATTAEIVKQEILKSEIKFEGFDVERGRAYLAINKEEERSRLSGASSSIKTCKIRNNSNHGQYYFQVEPK